jgi:integrase
MLGRGLSPASVRRHHALLHASLARAVKWGLIGTNPADRATPPTSRQAQVEAPAVNDVIRLIKAATLKGDAVLATAMALAAVTGMRRGELCALRWSDIDPQQATVRVRRSLTTRGDHHWEGDTKTHRHRDVTLDPSAVALLERRARQEEYAKEVGTKLVANAYVLSTHAGGSQPCLPDSLGRAYWRLAHQIGVQARFHDLRHFAATQAIAASIDVSTVAGRLGHADPAITLRVYSHVLAERDRAAAALLGGLVLGPETPDAGGVGSAGFEQEEQQLVGLSVLAPPG